MKISLNWLRELVDLPASATPEDVATILTRQGLEVEGIEAKGRELQGVLVAEVLTVRPHPKADKLRIVEIRSGERQENVVCGALNVPAPGGKVCWAAPGATLPGGLKLEARDVRGVLSPGMLCGESELGLSQSDDGLLILDSDTPHGAEVATTIGARDDIFEVNVTPNRGDALSHLGIARELAAHYGLQVRLPSVEGIPIAETGPTTTIAIHDPAGCYRYLARTLVGLRNDPSPAWMRIRLGYCGMRAISILVDITNYVLLELGHPQHAFDWNLLQGDVSVRRAHAGELIKTLDGQFRPLLTDDLVIADVRGPIAIAGVMGGEETEVSGITESILLETAAFAPRSIRKTAKRLGLSSEASYRFERGVNADSVPIAAMRACSLFAKYAGGRLVNAAVDLYPTVSPPIEVTLSKARLRRVTGRDFELSFVQNQLTRLGFMCVHEGDSLVAKVPSFRSDVAIPEDLIEELLRMGEYERPTEVGRIESNATSRVNPESVADKSRLLLAGQGLSEIISWAFVPKSVLHTIAGEGADPSLADGIVVKNPISADYEVMRTSLVPGLVAALKRNLSRGVASPWLFEVGPVIHRAKASGADPEQATHAAGVLVGNRAGWLKPAESVDFFDAKRVVAELIGALGVANPAFVLDAQIPFLHPGISARVVAEKPLGILGQIHPRIAKKLDLDAPVFYFEVWIDSLDAQPRSLRSVAPPRFPSITRDISFWIDSDIPADVQRDALFGGNEPLLVSLAVLEAFRDPRYVPVGKKGMLWTLTYRSNERTLTDTEVDQAHSRVLAQMATRLTIQIR